MIQFSLQTRQELPFFAHSEKLFEALKPFLYYEHLVSYDHNIYWI